MRCSCVPQSKNDNAWQETGSERCDLPKVKVKGKNNALFGNRFGKDRLVRQAVTAFLTEMLGIMPLLAEPL